MGHMFSIGDAGGVGGGYPCVPMSAKLRNAITGEHMHKANGGTAVASPRGDSFDVNMVALALSKYPRQR